MNINILSSAQQDIIDAYWFYEEQEEGLGQYFLTSFTSDVERLEIIAGGHEIHFGFHRMVAAKFPFSIFYLIENNEIDIYAIIDDRKDPKLTSKRLSSDQV